MPAALRFPLWLDARRTECLPALLPVRQRQLRLFQRGTALLAQLPGRLFLGLEHRQLFLEGGEQHPVVLQVGLGFAAGLFGFAQIVLQLPLALLTCWMVCSRRAMSTPPGE